MMKKMASKKYDVAIVGAGPAGAAAAVTAARKGLKSLLLLQAFGGQARSIRDIHNWLGEVHITGRELAGKLESHVAAFVDEVEIKQPEQAAAVTRSEDGFIVHTSSRQQVESKAVVLATGARRRTLNVRGEQELTGKGVSYCPTCDAPYFRGRTVAVVGGGEAGQQAVADLLRYATRVYLLEMGEQLTRDFETWEVINQDPRVEIILQAQIKEILGEDRVTGLAYRDLAAGTTQQLKLEGVFVEIGSVPNSQMVKELVDLDQAGFIKVNAATGATSCPGLFAAGDVADNPYRHIQIAAGDGMKAALAAYDYLSARHRPVVHNKRHKEVMYGSRNDHQQRRLR